MSGRFRGAAIEGEFARYDGTNAAEIATFAGDQYEGPGGDGNPLVRGPDGDLQALRPGWVLTRVPGTEGVGITSATAWGIWAEEAA